jgi:hypothetical protein
MKLIFLFQYDKVYQASYCATDQAWRAALNFFKKAGFFNHKGAWDPLRA